MRPPSNNSSHTPILPTKKIRPPRDDSLPSPRGVAMPGMMGIMTDNALMLSLSRLLALPQPGLGHPDQQVHPGPAAAGGGRRRSHQGGQAGANTAQENQVSGEWAEGHQVYPLVPGAKNKRCYSTTMPALPAHANVNV